MLLFSLFFPVTIIGIIILSAIRKNTKKTNPKFFWISFLIFLLIEFLFVYFIIILPTIKENAALNSGVSAPAKIISVKATGNKFNYNPEVKMILDVQPIGMPSYTVEKKLVINVVDIPKYTEGTTVTTLLDPNDKNNFLIKGLDSPE